MRINFTFNHFESAIKDGNEFSSSLYGPLCIYKCDSTFLYLNTIRTENLSSTISIIPNIISGRYNFTSNASNWRLITLPSKQFVNRLW